MDHHIFKLYPNKFWWRLARMHHCTLPTPPPHTHHLKKFLASKSTRIAVLLSRTHMLGHLLCVVFYYVILFQAVHSKMPTILVRFCDYLVTIRWKRNYAIQHGTSMPSVEHHCTKNSQKGVHSNEVCYIILQ
jgi:hypothetical protein